MFFRERIDDGKLWREILWGDWINIYLKISVSEGILEENMENDGKASEELISLNQLP